MDREELRQEAKERSENYFREKCHERNKWADACDLERMWLDGAKFGYNKAMNEQGYKVASAYDEGVAIGRDRARTEFAKAKEVMEGLMRFCRCFAQHHLEDIRYKEAEQFLEET